jgi:hypothetical protein
MGIRMNNNHRTDQEFENFLESIGGVTLQHKPHLGPITERRYFSIGNGWLGIVQRLFETLIVLGWDKEMINVKEKFGGMSIFLSNVPENGFNFIFDAERETFSTCEVCGEPGENQKIKGWVYTLCDEHRDEKLIIENEGKKYIIKEKEKVQNGDLYYNAQTHEVLKCEMDVFFDPWSVKVIELIKNND